MIEDVRLCFICGAPTGCEHLERELRDARQGRLVYRSATGLKMYRTDRPAQIERDELIEKVERGWGETPGTDIPPDWRERPGPAISHFRKW